jgi:FixJ family two-component response regulator
VTFRLDVRSGSARGTLDESPLANSLLSGYALGGGSAFRSFVGAKMSAVLVVEDDERAARIFGRILRSKGLEIEHVATKSAALRALGRDAPWRAFLIDLQLTPSTYERLDVLDRVAAVFPTTPRAVVSGLLNRALINRTACAGATFICKPCSGDELARFAAEAMSSCIDDVELRKHIVEWGRTVGLTPKQQEVVALVVGGRTRTESRDASSVGEKTLASHIGGILAKAEIHGVAAENMAALALWLARGARARRRE